MVQTPVRQITLEEFLKLPETKPASEYISGQVIQKPMPQGHHSNCLAYGLQMGWLIDPSEQSVIVSRMGHNTEVIDESPMTLPVPGFAAAIELSIGQMFKWLDVV